MSDSVPSIEKTPGGPAGPERPAKGKRGDGANSPFAQRTIARAWALQSAYSWLQGAEVRMESDALPREFPDDPEGIAMPGAEVREFGEQLARHVHENATALDALLRPCLHNWRIDRLATIDHLLLRLAVAELQLYPETPYKVVLNEYIELAKDFGSTETPRFVNGVLDNLARRLRPDEAEPKAPRAPLAPPGPMGLRPGFDERIAAAPPQPEAGADRAAGAEEA